MDLEPSRSVVQPLAAQQMSAAADARVPAAIACRGVMRRFRTPSGRPHEVLSRVDLEVEPATLCIVSGRSGAGKTTLLHLIATLDRPDGGQILIHGRDVASLDSDELAALRRRSIGIVYQVCVLIPRYRVWQNVALPLVPEGMSVHARRERSAQVLERLALLHKIDERPSHLSGGEQQRVAIARALVGQPTILIADEPTSQVDAETRALIVAEFRALRASGVTVVASSHAEELWSVADSHWRFGAHGLERASALP